MEDPQLVKIIVRLLNKSAVLRDRLSADDIVYILTREIKETKDTINYIMHVGNKHKFRKVLGYPVLKRAFKLHNSSRNMLFCVSGLDDSHHVAAGVVYYDHSMVCYYDTRIKELIKLIPDKDIVNSVASSSKVKKADFCCNPSCTTTEMCRKQCSRCRGVVYCFSACQHAHWSSHKPNCHQYIPIKLSGKTEEPAQQQSAETTVQAEYTNQPEKPTQQTVDTVQAEYTNPTEQSAQHQTPKLAPKVDADPTEPPAQQQTIDPYELD